MKSEQKIQTPMQKLKHLFQNLEQKFHLEELTVLHQRSEKKWRGYSWNSHTTKKIETDFVRLLSVPKNSLNIESIAFSFDYIDVDTKITTSTRSIDLTVNYSKIYSFDEFKQCLKTLIKNLPEKCDVDTFFKVYFESFAFEEQENVNTKIEEDISKVSPLIEQLKASELDLSNKQEQLKKVKVKISKELQSSEEHQEFSELLRQKGELDKKIALARKNADNKLVDIEMNKNLYSFEVALQQSQQRVNDTKDSINKFAKQICVNYPKNLTSFILKKIEEIKNN